MVNKLFGGTGVKLEAFITRYEDAVPVENGEVNWNGEQGGAVAGASGDAWKVKLSYEGAMDSSEGLALTVVFRSEGYAKQSAAAVSFSLSNWSSSNYVLVPGAVYAGNRFEVRELPYAPCWTKLDEHGPDVPTIITDVPRLSKQRHMPSAFHLLTGDAATPIIGIFDEKMSVGWLFETEQATVLGDTSIHMEESLDRSSARISFQAPGVRPVTKYEMATTKAPSDDRGHDFELGEIVQVRCRVYRFPCEDVKGLFQKFASIRTSGKPSAKLASSLPFSAAWEIQEKKYNELNWNEQLGYYAVGTIDMKHQDWQIGWVGGGMSSYALLLEGNDESVERTLETLEFMFRSQTESGFFHGVCYQGEWYGDEFNDAPDRLYPERWHILRKSADALYFIMKHFIALERLKPEFQLPPSWTDGTRRLADAFVRLWQTYGQFGQWVHTGTGDIIIGGSAGAGIAPAGLALCSRYFGDSMYMEVAKESAESFYQQFTAQGVTTGGPGEILQCPDSESAFGLLESYIVLYETSGEKAWIDRAEEAAQQAMTWCVSYDFRFPEESTFGRLGIRTTGSVIANVQNKHSAPGICTLSGDSLLKLYRATGKAMYMELLREIAGNLPQYLSRSDRPVRGWDGHNMPPGYMSERVNMSDWEGKGYVGEVIPYSCWCEVSLMLTYAELPGIYVDLANDKVFAIDQVECGLIVNEQGERILSVCNKSVYPAAVKVLVENRAEAAKPLGQCASAGWQRVEVRPGETTTIPL
ncbi:hypothetical protein [Paenibacillus sp. 2TAB19]|uniref:hypothetical protein n=1 Tax=Paenibacillus sp. 2TAB19 TaxID=3233003 RepID=UPI003F9BD610